MIALPAFRLIVSSLAPASFAGILISISSRICVVRACICNSVIYAIIAASATLVVITNITGMIVPLITCYLIVPCPAWICVISEGAIASFVVLAIVSLFVISSDAISFGCAIIGMSGDVAIFMNFVMRF